jgi:hypothetical protein
VKSYGNVSGVRRFRLAEVWRAAAPSDLQLSSAGILTAELSEGSESASQLQSVSSVGCARRRTVNVAEEAAFLESGMHSTDDQAKECQGYSAWFRNYSRCG